MPTYTSEVGLRPPTVTSSFSNATYGVGIDTAKGIAIPATIVRPAHAGFVECYLSMEGTVTARYRWDGADPTTTVGILLPAPSATVPIQLVLVGELLINAFKIIGTAAGNTISYTYAWRDMG